MNIPSYRQTLDVPRDVCFESTAKSRRFDYSGARADNGSSPCMASSSNACNNPDRFLPTLTSRMPLYATSQTSRYAAELLSLVDATYQPLVSGTSSSDPTLIARLYHAQSLNIKKRPVPSRYSAAQIAGSKPDFNFDMGCVEQFTAAHPCAWSSQNVVAAILCDDVYVHSIDNGMIADFEDFDPARSVEWLPDHTLAIGDVMGNVSMVDVNASMVKTAWHIPLSPWESQLELGFIFPINSLHYSRERQVLAAGRCSGSVTCYDPRMRGEIWTIQTFPDPATVKWSPDGLYLAIGGRRGNVRCADARSQGTFDLTLPHKQDRPAHKGTLGTSLAWAPWESHLLATGGSGKDGMVHLWSLSSSDMTNRSHRHLQSSMFSSEVTSLHFSPHTRELLMTYGKAIKKRCAEALKPSSHRRHSRTIPPVPPPPRGIAVYSYPSLKRVHAVDAHKSPIFDSVLSTDGTSLLTYGKDEMVKTWKIWGEREKKKSPTMMEKLYLR